MNALRALAGAGLLVVAAGLVVTSGSLESGASARAQPNRPIATATPDPNDIRANNSPTIVANPVDPGNLVVVNRVDTPTYGCALRISDDGGVTWREGALPFPDGEELPARCFAPDAGFGSDGTLHVVFATLKGRGNSPNAVWSASSPDGGDSFSVPTKVLGRLSFQVRLLVDPTTPGRLYLSWLAAESVGVALFPTTNNPITVARSDDGGTTWGQGVRVSPPTRQRVVAPSMALDDDGRLLVLYMDLGDDRLDYNGGHGWRAGLPYGGTWSIVLARSSDEGASWEEQVVDDAVVPTKRFLIFLPQSPSLAVDPRTGRVYVGFADGRLGDPDVWVRTADGAGQSFADRQKVNDTADGDGRDQYLPRLAVAPGGRLDVVYYDRRADPANVLNQVSFQSSHDDGASFGEARQLASMAFDSRIGFGSWRGLPDLGSRLGLLSTDTTARAVWTDTRAGTEQTNKQDLASAVIEFAPASSWRNPLRLVGWLVGLFGVAVAATSVVGRPSGATWANSDEPTGAPTM